VYVHKCVCMCVYVCVQVCAYVCVCVCAHTPKISLHAQIAASLDRTSNKTQQFESDQTNENDFDLKSDAVCWRR